MSPVSFEIEGKKYYSAKDLNTAYGSIINAPDPESLLITETDGRLNISYQRTSDFINHDIYGIYLSIKGINARLETGNKISFKLSDNLEEYPSVVLHPIKTSSASDYDLYSAVNGWIQFDDIEWSTKTLSGRFEFDAKRVEDSKECNHYREIQVKNGSFRNIPFTVTTTHDSNGI